MHRLITEQRSQEKAEQLRQLKIRQQRIRAQRNQDEREIRDLMRDLEKRKEVCVIFLPARKTCHYIIRLVPPICFL